MDESREDLESYIDAIYLNMSGKNEGRRQGRRDSKRSRNDSSDTKVTFLLEIRESITNMKTQLKKLDLLKKLTADVEELK